VIAVGMPILCGAETRTKTSALRPQLGAWGRSTCRVLASPATHPCGPYGRQRNAGGEQRRWEPNPDQAYVLQVSQLREDTMLQACFSRPSSLQQSMGSGENGKRYQLHQPASLVLDQAGRTLSLQSNHINSASLQASDYNNGATLIPAGVVRIHFFLW